jgi:large subunit ribosomal protein L29
VKSKLEKGASAAELKKKKAALTKELFEMKIKNSIGQLSNPLLIRKARRDVARINTELTKLVAR